MASKLTRNYLPELLALKFRRSNPGMVTVNLTDKCNQKCIYCEIGENLPSIRKASLTVDDLKWIIDEMHINKVRKISLCGGEPFLFEGIFEVVLYAYSQNIRCSITSNGMIIHKLNDTQLLALKQCKTELNISIDSFDEAVQSKTRGTPLALTNALQSIIKLNEYGIPVTVLTVITRFNYEHLFEFFTSAHAKEIKQVLFQPVIYYSNYPDRERIESKPYLNVTTDQLPVLMEQLSKILIFERKHNINTNVYRIISWIDHYLTTAVNPAKGWFFNKVLKKFYCREIDAIIDISYDGGIQPCGLALSSVDIYKNREAGLIKLWLQATSDIRTDLRTGNYHNYCNGCCHHFSRNMLASIIKYPIKNRSALSKIMLLLFMRMYSRMIKKLTLKH